ncbi:RETICULATA, chloroplastic-like protein [Drosera capensis]
MSSSSLSFSDGAAAAVLDRSLVVASPGGGGWGGEGRVVGEKRGGGRDWGSGGGTVLLEKSKAKKKTNPPEQGNLFSRVISANRLMEEKKSVQWYSNAAILYLLWHRMLADPAFLYRLLFEQATTIGCSVWWELKCRKNRIKQEWYLALINVLTASACNAIVLWSLVPCRSYGNTFTFDLQKLPNNMFERCPIKPMCFSLLLSLTCGVTHTHFGLSFGRVSLTIPSVSTNALGYGAFLGIYTNLRYQFLCGFDRAVTSYFDVIGVALCFSAAMRVLNVQLGETSRLAWLGVEEDPLASGVPLNAYERPSASDSNKSAGGFLPKLGLGLLGIKQDTSSEPQAQKPRRKKIVRRKVVASS